MARQFGVETPLVVSGVMWYDPSEDIVKVVQDGARAYQRRTGNQAGCCYVSPAMGIDGSVVAGITIIHNSSIGVNYYLFSAVRAHRVAVDSGDTPDIWGYDGDG